MNVRRVFRLLAAPILLFTRADAVSDPGIIAFEGSALTWTNDNTNLEYRIESAPSPGHTFTDRHDHLDFVRATGTITTTTVPLFFRVAGTNALPARVYRASDLPFAIAAGTNARVTIEWATSPDGPWQTQWTAPQEAAVTGTTTHIATPNFLRVNFVNCPSNFAACAAWTDATDPGASRTITAVFSGGFQYAPRCLKIRAGQSVTFSMSLASHPLVADCQDHASITNTASGSSAVFSFPYPGYYGFHCAIHGPGGMSGNLWVIP